MEGKRHGHFFEAIFPARLIETCIMPGCPRDGVVPDPFTGAGTTAVASRSLGRGYIGIELNASYIELAENRLNNFF